MGERHRSQYKTVDKTQSIVKTIAASKAVQRQMTMYVRGSVYRPHSQSGKPTAHMFTLDLPTELSRHELNSPFQGLIEHVDTCYQAQTIARGSVQQVALSVVSGVLRRCTVPCCLYCQLIPSDEGQKWSSGLSCESGSESRYMLSMREWRGDMKRIDRCLFRQLQDIQTDLQALEISEMFAGSMGIRLCDKVLLCVGVVEHRLVALRKIFGPRR